MKRVAMSLGVLIGLASPTAANEPPGSTVHENGRLCLAAAHNRVRGRLGWLGNPTGDLPNVTYSIHVDGRSPVELSRSSGTWIVGLALNQRHSVAILANGIQIESFYFRFDPSETTELCLFMKLPHETWILWPLKKTGSWCSCGPPPAA